VQVVEISKNKAINFITEYHYSKVLPRLNKTFIGGYHDGRLVAVMTLGWGTRPLHTIKKIFSTLTTKDYFELGKLCVSDDMPRNTESFFISKCIKFIQKKYPEKKILFSWADGIIGKPGYVYQASNFFFFFGGYIKTEMYIDSSGNRVHPRSFQGFSPGAKQPGAKYRSRSYETTTKYGYIKYFGYQFRYVYPLCDKKEWQQLLTTSPCTWQRGNYPKDKDCRWWKQTDKGKREECDMPAFEGTRYKKSTKDIVDVFF
jgi:hypothetical protein